MSVTSTPSQWCHPSHDGKVQVGQLVIWRAVLWHIDLFDSGPGSYSEGTYWIRARRVDTCTLRVLVQLLVHHRRINYLDDVNMVW